MGIFLYFLLCLLPLIEMLLEHFIVGDYLILYLNFAVFTDEIVDCLADSIWGANWQQRYT